MMRQPMFLLEPKKQSRRLRRLLLPRLQSPKRSRPVVTSNIEEIAYLSYSNSLLVFEPSINIQTVSSRIFCE